MTRSRFFDRIDVARTLDATHSAWSPAANATVRVRNPGTAVDISDSIYAGPSGGSPLSQPLSTDAAGHLLFYLDAEIGREVDLYVTAPGYAPFTVSNVTVAPVSTSLVTLNTPQTLTGPKTLSSPILDNVDINGGVAEFDAGSVSSPAVRLGSGGPGWYGVGTDQMRLAIGGADGVRIDNGAVGMKGTVTGAKIQALLDAGFPVTLPAGTHTFGTKITVPAYGVIRGAGQQATILEWTGASSGIMFEYTAGSFTPSHITVSDLTLRTSVASVTGIRVVNGGFETFANLTFLGVSKHLDISGGFRPSARNVLCAGYASNGAGGSVFDTVPHVDIDGFTSYGASSATALLRFIDVAVATVTNGNLYGSGTVGIRIEGASSQGVCVTNTVMTSVTTGVTIRSAASGNPSFILLNGCAIDQMTTYGIEVAQGTSVRIIGCDITNTQGSAGAGTAIGIIMSAYPTVEKVAIHGCHFENLGPGSIQGVASAGHFEATGNYFMDGPATPAGAAAVIIGGGATNEVLIAHNDFSHVTLSIVDQATSGTNRWYLDNLGPLPAITTVAGTLVRHASQVQTDGIVKAKQISTPSNPSSGYDALYFKSDDNLYKLTAAGDEVRVLDADVFTTNKTVLQGTGAEGWTETGSPTLSGTLTVETDVVLTAPWSTFTPTLTQNGARTTSAASGRYRKFGKLAVVEISLTCSNAGTAGNTIQIGGLPAALQPLHQGNGFPLGTFVFWDQGTAFYHGYAIATSNTTIEGIAHAGTNTMGINSPNAALANTDVVSCVLTYETA